MSDKYRFLKTTEKDGHVLALIGDQDVLGEGGIDSLRKAFNAHASPLMREGVMALTKEQVQALLNTIDNVEMPESGSAFRRALVCIDAKVNGTKPAMANIVLPKHKMN